MTYPTIRNADAPSVLATVAIIQAAWAKEWDGVAHRDRWPHADAAIASLPNIESLWNCAPELRYTILDRLVDGGAILSSMEPR